MDLFDLTPLLGIPAVVKVIDAYRQAVIEQGWRKFGFTVGSWVLGVGLVALAAQTSLELPEWNWAEIILIGIGVGATGSVLHDVAKKEPVDPVTLVTTTATADAPASEDEPPGV
jgi:hypothetical protein